jgi:hypothetical protein
VPSHPIPVRVRRSLAKTGVVSESSIVAADTRPAHQAQVRPAARRSWPCPAEGASFRRALPSYE